MSVLDRFMRCQTKEGGRRLHSMRLQDSCLRSELRYAINSRCTSYLQAHRLISSVRESHPRRGQQGQLPMGWEYLADEPGRFFAAEAACRP